MANSAHTNPAMIMQYGSFNASSSLNRVYAAYKNIVSVSISTIITNIL